MDSLDYGIIDLLRLNARAGYGDITTEIAPADDLLRRALAIDEHGVNAKDFVIGIAASVKPTESPGRAPLSGPVDTHGVGRVHAEF